MDIEPKTLEKLIITIKSNGYCSKDEFFKIRGDCKHQPIKFFRKVNTNPFVGSLLKNIKLAPGQGIEIYNNRIFLNHPEFKLIKILYHRFRMTGYKFIAASKYTSGYELIEVRD